MVTRTLSYGVALENAGFSGAFSVDAATTTGLTFGYTAGYIVSILGRTNVVAGTVTLTDNATNWIYTAGASVAVNSGANPTGNTVLYKVTTASGVITAIVDYRGALVTNKVSFT
jgi:hypothetical protein